jgi:predicted GIY-YIG superfamily endonuclease
MNKDNCNVYLIHFDRPYKHAQHYLGSANNVEERIKQHRNNSGARLLQVINNAGINWTVVSIWKNVGRDFERKLKRCHSGRQLCRICKSLREKK